MAPSQQFPFVTELGQSSTVFGAEITSLTPGVKGWWWEYAAEYDEVGGRGGGREGGRE